MHLIICTTSSVFPNLLIGIPLITESKPSLVSSLYRSRTSGVSTALGIRQFTWILGDNSNAKHFVNAKIPPFALQKFAPFFLPCIPHAADTFIIFAVQKELF